MKCALNNRDLYNSRSTNYICEGCALLKYFPAVCKKAYMCDLDSILKRSLFQSDIFKI